MNQNCIVDDDVVMVIVVDDKNDKIDDKMVDGNVVDIYDVGVIVDDDVDHDKDDEVDDKMVNENRVDVAEAVEVDSNDLVVSELLSTNDMHDFDVVSCNRDYFVALESVGGEVPKLDFHDIGNHDGEDEMVISDVICENMLHDFSDIVIDNVNVNDNVVS
ncbi:hypothetical protein EWB00_010844 [Schistosoma japonicum]|uniref:Uncharacterized protein n=1 Tax=Schistosoma japonicum TaxID=6182 RepID=A0A4Z2DNQ8_SCHJA|nr:hypothetical protein EWB00_010844 [Schistosoma japonicum]